MEKTAWVVILALNLAGIIFMVGTGAGKLIKNHMARFNIVEEDELFDIEDITEKDPDMTGSIKEASASPEEDKAPAKKPTFDIDDFDFDL